MRTSLKEKARRKKVSILRGKRLEKYPSKARDGKFDVMFEKRAAVFLDPTDKTRAVSFFNGFKNNPRN